ncbi:MAG TPA: replicative DNA helicase [candidate division WOR-3 bacterium]|uniref:Replicative DNA helicase n=1 Tax=candidate division WOR-3 bacterium TaxID=2052148 RepID=A0A7C5DAT4_UNCW3|nr:replicative DNA helicase [candidate division WOR-3 bacterium]
MVNETLPQAIDVERSVLGSLIVDMEAIGRVEGILSSDDFYLQSHKAIYETILSLYGQGKPVDLLLVTEELKNKKMLDKVGGAAYISSLAENVYSSANITKYAEIIYEKSVLREIIKTSNTIIEKAAEGVKSVEELLDEAESLILGIRQRKKMGQIEHLKRYAEDVFRIIQERAERKSVLTGLATDFTRFDSMTAGFQKGDFIVIAGRPSSGKTAIGLNIAMNMAIKHKIPVVFFSLEMHWEAIVFRMLSSLSGIASGSLRRGFVSTEDEWYELGTAVSELSEAPIYLDSTPSLTIYELRAKARRMKKQYNIGAVFVDYLQLIKGPKTENRQQEVAAISRALKSISLELHIPVVALAQLSRASEVRGGRAEVEAPPKLSDLRDSGQIEQDADVVAFLYRKRKRKNEEELREDDKKEIPVEVIIAKQRNGPVGSFKLMFQRDRLRFVNIKEDRTEDDRN